MRKFIKDMKINSNSLTFKGINSNKIVLKGLEMISEHSSTFGVGVSFLSAITLRPLAINLTPNSKKENKKTLSANSIGSGIAKLISALAITLPLENTIKKIDKNPEKFLDKKTIETFLKKNLDTNSSKDYKFLTQIIKSSGSLISSIPKTLIAVAIIPYIDKILNTKPEPKLKKNENTSFCAKFDKTVSKVINNNQLQNFATKNINKAKNINRNITIATDMVLASFYTLKTKSSKKIEDKKKNILIKNELISTGLCLLFGGLIDKLMQFKNKNFIEKFIQENKNNPKLIKYLEGINILRPTLIFALIYYAMLPIISTYIADKASSN